MGRRIWIRILSVLIVIVVIFLAFIGFAYHSWRSTTDLTFDFLADQEPLHRGIHNSPWGAQVVTVYCFPGYHDSVSYSASEEVLDLGYIETSRPISYDRTEHMFDPRYRRVTTEFRKDGVFWSISIRIGKGRFLEERPDGNFSFSMELDWINVVIRRTRSPFSFRRVLHYYSDKLSRQSTRQSTAPRRG